MTNAPTSAPATLLRLPRSFWLLWAGALVNRIGTFVLPFLSLWLTSTKGYTPERAGLVASLLGLGALCAAPSGGLLADRIGRRAVMAGALGLGATSLLALGTAQAEWAVAGSAFLFGFLNEQYRPALSAAVADLVPPQERLRAYGFVYWAANLGFAISLPLGGWLAGHGYRLLFAVDAGTSLAFAVAILLLVPETRPPRDASRPAAHPLAPLADGPFVLFCACSLGIAAVFHQCFLSLPLAMRAHGLTDGQFGMLLSLNGVVIVLCQPLVAGLIERFPRPRVLAVSAVWVGAGMGLTAFARGPLGYGATIVFWTLGEILLSGAGPAVVADRAPPDARGSYQGLFQMAWGAAAFLGPLVGGAAYGRWGEGAVWAGCAGVGLVVAGGHLVAGRLLARGE